MVYREAEGALQQIAGQWEERFQQIQAATPGQEHVPPVLIIVCDNTDIAEVFYRKISGEREEEIVTEADVRGSQLGGRGERTTATAAAPAARKSKAQDARRSTARARSSWSSSRTRPTEKRTIRIDTKLLAEAESDDPTIRGQDAAEELRRVVATVGKPGQPGEHVRCVVSVAMLTEGWDANNVTHILGMRAFGSQLLCEQVVGRGLRRMDYVARPEDGPADRGIRGRVRHPVLGDPVQGPAARSKRARGQAQEPRAGLAGTEGDGDAVPGGRGVCLRAAEEPDPLRRGRRWRGWTSSRTGSRRPRSCCRRLATGKAGLSQLSTPLQIRRAGPASITTGKSISRPSSSGSRGWCVERVDRSMRSRPPDAKRRVLRLQSRHQLFPQVYGYVDEYVRSKVNFKDCHPCELGLEKYVSGSVERLRDAIVPDEAEGEPPADADPEPLQADRHYGGGGFQDDAAVPRDAAEPHQPGSARHVDLGERARAFHLERSEAVKFYARNDHLGLLIPYEYMGVDHDYDPDFLVRLADDMTLVLEIKGLEDEQDRAKHNAAHRWVSAVNNWGQLGGGASTSAGSRSCWTRSVAYVHEGSTGSTVMSADCTWSPLATWTHHRH